MPPSPSTALVELWSRHPFALFEAVAVGAVGNGRSLVDAGQRRLHAQRLEDAFAQEARVILLRSAFHHQGQQREATVAVLVAPARLEQRAILGFQDLQHVGIAHLRGVVRHEVFVIDQAAAVAQQLAQRDLARRRRQ